jgi:hypothetical protein
MGSEPPLARRNNRTRSDTNSGKESLGVHASFLGAPTGCLFTWACSVGSNAISKFARNRYAARSCHRINPQLCRGSSSHPTYNWQVNVPSEISHRFLSTLGLELPCRPILGALLCRVAGVKVSSPFVFQNDDSRLAESSCRTLCSHKLKIVST